MNIKLSRMNILDLPEVMKLERASFTSPWSERFFRDELEREYSFVMLARDESGELAGFICFWILVDEMHILNLAVRSDFRRMGVGTAIVKEALAFAGNRGVRSATLEVRESNSAAMELYAGLGFKIAGKRKRYYDSPRENAVIMWLYDIGRYAPKSP